MGTLFDVETVALIRRQWSHIRASDTPPMTLLSAFRNNMTALAPSSEILFAALPLSDCAGKFVKFIDDFVTHDLDDEQGFLSKIGVLKKLIQVCPKRHHPFPYHLTSMLYPTPPRPRCCLLVAGHTD